MSRRICVAVALVTAALASSLLLARRSVDREPAVLASVPAEEIHLEGLDAFSRWDERELFRRMQAAWSYEPVYIPAIIDLHTYYGESVRLPSDVRSALTSLVEGDPRGSGLCAAFVLAQKGSLSGLGLSLDNLDAAANHPCGLITRLQVPSATRPDERLELAERLWRRYPSSVRLANDYLALLLRTGERGRILEFAAQLSSVDHHPLLRATGFGWRVGTLQSLGRQAESAAVEQEAEALTRPAEPGIRSAYLDALGTAIVQAQPAYDDPRWPRTNRLTRYVYSERLRLLDRADLYNEFVIRRDCGRLALDDGELTQSLSHWDRLAETIDTFPAQLQALIYMRRGRTLSKLGRLREAEAPLLAAREKALASGEVYRSVETEHNLLHVYEGLGWDDQAHRAGQAFVDLARKMEDLRPVRMMAYHDYATYLHLRGEHETARPMFEAMIAAADSLGENDHWIGEYYELIGDLGRALAYYRKVWEGRQPVVGRSLNALTRLSEATGDSTSALRYARAHDALVAQGSKHPESSPLVPGVLARSGQVDAAIDELQRSRLTAAGRGQAAAWAQLTLEQAELEAGLGNSDLAIALADSAAAESVAGVALTVRARAFGALNRISRDGGAGGEAVELLRQAARVAERARSLQLATDVQRMLGGGLVLMGRVDEALAAYARAATLSDSLARSLSHDVVRASFRAKQLLISDHALAAVLSEATHREAPARFAAWSMRRKGRGISRDWPTLGSRQGTDALRRIQAALGDDRAVIDYVILESGAAALVVTSERARIVQLPLQREALTQRVRELVTGIVPRLGSFVDLSRSCFDKTAAHLLYLDLLAPLEPYLRGRDQLIIVPDAPLQLVPFDALLTSADGQPPAQLIDRYTISTVTSLADRAADLEQLPVGAVVAVAPLKGVLAADREIDAIAQALAARPLVRLQGNAATESAVREHSRNAAVLHFAAHAHPNDIDPDFARLDLAAEGDDDGHLYAYEIRQLQLPGSLVILSACESAAGRMLAGAGPLSLSRAFLQAGASGVVGTLWPIGDEAAAELMVAFHEALARGLPPAQALSHAKRSLRATRADPFYWAPFLLVAPGL
ncbi:MAG: CHAT domain-containing protein [Gemmatimonadota bacterium]|nr:MAG: CHAT domain-containing protein [Gemmatimonadota bacterium]